MTSLAENPRLTGDWFFELDQSGFLQGVRVTRRLASEKSPFQEMEVIECDPFGRALILRTCGSNCSTRRIRNT